MILKPTKCKLQNIHIHVLYSQACSFNNLIQLHVKKNACNK